MCTDAIDYTSNIPALYPEPYLTLIKNYRVLVFNGGTVGVLAVLRIWETFSSWMGSEVAYFVLTVGIKLLRRKSLLMKVK